MKKVYDKLKNNNWLILTLILSTIAISVIYILQKIAPFGNNSMLDVDFYHQYGPLLNELYDRVKSGESLLYSFNTGLGIPFYRNFLNYLSSPFNVVLFLFKKENIVMAFSVIIALKVIFASLSMAFYLKKTFNKSGALASIFAIFYAFSGYFCAYYWNIMWLDGMVFLPLIAYGINKIIDDKKPLFYIISLAVMLISNYFIAYMICIFSVMYFIAYLLYRRDFSIKYIIKKDIKTIILFGISSILAAGLVCFALLPLYFSLNSISATKGLFPNQEFQFSISNFMFNHLSGVNRTVFASDILPLPNVYPGLLTLVSLSLLFINKKVNIRFKFISASALIIFFLLFNVNTLDYIMHAFHVPNDLPWRYSFIYVFVMTTIGYYSFSKIKEVSVVRISVSFAIIIILCLLASKLSFANIDDKRVIMCLILLITYYALTLLLRRYDKYFHKFIIALAIVSVFEVVYSINVNWNIDHDIKTFMSDKKNYQKLINYITKEDNDLYRIEKTGYLTLNDGAWYDYKGVSTFTSMAYENVAKNQRMLGMGGNDINSYYYKEYQTPVYNTMFNVKYLLGNYIKNDYYNVIKSIDGYNLISYDKYSSIAYAIDPEIKNWKLISYKPFLNQSNFVTLSTKVNDVFNSVKVNGVEGAKILEEQFKKNSNGEFNYKIDNNSKEIIFTLNNDKKQNIYIYVGGSNISNFYVDEEYYSLTSDEYYITDIGEKEKGNVEIRINLNDSNDGIIYFYAYALNKENYNKFYEKINNEKLNVSKYNDVLIEGDITASSDKTVFTSISYDKGWSVFVDGKRKETYKIADSYLGFDIKKGKHFVTLKYYPTGMKEGLIISAISLLFIIMMTLVKTKEEFKNIKKGEFIV